MMYSNDEMRHDLFPIALWQGVQTSDVPSEWVHFVGVGPCTAPRAAIMICGCFVAVAGASGAVIGRTFSDAFWYSFLQSLFVAPYMLWELKN